MEGISEIHWHDSALVSCVEIPLKDQLIFNVEYPEDWQANLFIKRAIVFTGFHALEVNEIPFEGNPTILSAEVVSSERGYFKVKIETNAGYRLVSAQAVSLLSSLQYT